eukprot:gene2749-4157_t
MEVLLQGSNIGEFISNFDVEKDDIYWNTPDIQHIFPFASVAIYFILVFLLQKIWGKRVLPGIKIILPLWNGFLAILSVAMLFGLTKYWLEVINDIGFENALCTKTVWLNHPLSFWAYIFALSKYFELFDTLWLILNGKSVPFLHWWHHITVLLFTWYSGVWFLSIAFIFAIMNSFIHSFMYTYYFLMSIKIKPSWAKLLTIGQITQMIIGISVISWFFVKVYSKGEKCHCDRTDYLAISCIAMYGSYLILFVRFYIQRYIFTNDDKKTK